MLQDKYMPRDRYMIAAILFFLLLMNVKWLIEIGVLNKKMEEVIGRQALMVFNAGADYRDIKEQEEVDIESINDRLNKLALKEGVDTELNFVEVSHKLTGRNIK